MGDEKGGKPMDKPMDKPMKPDGQKPMDDKGGFKK